MFSIQLHTWIECLLCAYHWVRHIAFQFHCSFWGLFFFFFYKTPSFPRSLASKEWIWGTMSHSQREMAVSTGQRERHSGTQLVGFAADTVSNLGHHSWRIKWENTRGILSLHFLCPHFPWSNLLLHRGRGTGSGQWGLPVLTSSSKCHW